MIDTTLVRFADTLQTTIPTSETCSHCATFFDSFLNMGWPSAFVMIAAFAFILGLIIIRQGKKEREKRMVEDEEEVPKNDASKPEDIETLENLKNEIADKQRLLDSTVIDASKQKTYMENAKKFIDEVLKQKPSNVSDDFINNLIESYIELMKNQKK